MAANQILVPDIGDAENVEVIEVCVHSGDTIEPEDPIVVLESDKATIEVPAPEAGKVSELKVQVGDKVSEGDLLLLLSADSSAVAAEPDNTVTVESVADLKENGAEIANSEPTTAEHTQAEAKEETLLIPDFGDDGEVDVIEVSVAVGDTIEMDQPILTLESDKASMEIPATAEGVIKSILVAEGDKVSEGTPFLVIDSIGGTASESADQVSQPTEVTETTSTEKETVTESATAKVENKAISSEAASSGFEIINTSKSVHAGPAVRRLANQLGVDLSLVNGTGRKKRIIKDDVHSFVKKQMTQPAAGQGTGTGLPELPLVDFSKYGPIETQELSRIQQVSASNLHRAWVTIPHVTQHDEADITDMDAFRKEQAPNYRDQGIKLTPLAFLVKASAAALREFPKFCSSLDPSGKSLIMKDYCHIGIAVDTPNGLVVPVIRDADKKSIVELAEEMQILSQKARDKKLSPADMSGGCFSISSLGGIGGVGFTPVVNWPEVAILGVSRSEIKPVYKDGEFVPRLKLPLSLSYDHRVIDGADAARFIVYLSSVLSDLKKMIL